MINYYQILEVKENASDEEIKSSYKRLAKKYHPDGDNKFNNEELFKLINEAYKILSDKYLRMEYDNSLHFSKFESEFNQSDNKSEYQSNSENNDNHYNNYNNKSNNSKIGEKIFYAIILILFLLFGRGYINYLYDDTEQSNKSEDYSNNDLELNSNSNTSQNQADELNSLNDMLASKEVNKLAIDFIPEGYILFEEIFGDLNKDGLEDCILIIKGTDKSKIVDDERYEGGKADRNRRGILVLLNKGDYYNLLLENRECFSSENEDGGIYFPPELSVWIENENLYIYYWRGRYGDTKYTFKCNNNDIVLIGYDRASKTKYESEWVEFDEVSINFLTKKILTKDIIDIDEDGKPTYEEKWSEIYLNYKLRLSMIDDFDYLNLDKIYRILN